MLALVFTRTILLRFLRLRVVLSVRALLLLVVPLRINVVNIVRQSVIVFLVDTLRLGNVVWDLDDMDSTWLLATMLRILLLGTLLLGMIGSGMLLRRLDGTTPPRKIHHLTT